MIVGKTCKCQNCGEIYNLEWDDHDSTHMRFCSGDCQYAGEVVPDYIRSTTGEERKHWEEELQRIKTK